MRYWHPFADMAAIEAGGELVIDRGEGSWVVDEQGRRYFDATAALWYCNVGHGRGEIVEAVARQLGRLASYSNFGDFATRPTLDLAERLGDLAPVPGSKVFLTSGGSDAVDTAAKLARRYFREVGQPERTVLVTRTNAYHGMHVGGTSLAGIDANVDGHGDLMGEVVRVAWDSPAALAALLEQLGPERVAAFYCEPVIGAGGVLPPPEGYLAEVRRLCREAGVLFVADEVITGFGRIGGAWFASTRFGLEPDLVLCAKGLTSGYVPMGAVLVAPHVAEPFWQGGRMWRHGYTYSGHAGAAAAALANLDLLERDGLLARAAELESAMARVLGPLAAHPLVGEVRAGTGALAAVEPDAGAVERDPTLPARLVADLRGRGVLTRLVGGTALQVSPPLVTTDADLDHLAGAVGEALDAVAGALTP